MSNKKTLGAIVPIYNEEVFLTESILRLAEIEIISEIILVDDNSTDSSFDLAVQITNKFQKIKLISNSKNYGKGFCVRRGLDELSTEYVVVHDADLEYNPNDIYDLYESLTHHPHKLILGSRVLGSKARKNIYLHTKLGNKAFALIFSLLHRIKVSDIASCYWILKRSKLIELNLSEPGFAIEIEILSKFLKNGGELKEVPISYIGRSYEEGKKITLKDAYTILFKLIKFKFWNS